MQISAFLLTDEFECLKFQVNQKTTAQEANEVLGAHVFNVFLLQKRNCSAFATHTKKPFE